MVGDQPRALPRVDFGRGLKTIGASDSSVPCRDPVADQSFLWERVCLRMTFASRLAPTVVVYTGYSVLIELLIPRAH